MEETATSTTISPDSITSHQPIILNPGIGEMNKDKSTRKNSRGALSTLSILIAGWFFGNLILLTFASVGIAFAAGSTGLVKVPFVSEKLFGATLITEPEVNELALENAQEKLNTIQTLSDGETLKSIALDEEEVNALLQKKVQDSSNFAIQEPYIKILEDQFVLTGKMKETNAPVLVTGKVDVSGIVANIEVTSAKFGKVDMPSFIANNLVNSYFAEIGLNLGSGQLPAKSIKLSEGLISLLEVSKTTEQ